MGVLHRNIKAQRRLGERGGRLVTLGSRRSEGNPEGGKLCRGEMPAEERVLHPIFELSLFYSV